MKQHKKQALKYITLRLFVPFCVTVLACTMTVRYVSLRFEIGISGGQYWLKFNHGTPTDLQNYNTHHVRAVGLSVSRFRPTLKGFASLPSQRQRIIEPTSLVARAYGFDNHLQGMVVATSYRVPAWCLWIPFLPFVLIAIRKWKKRSEPGLRKMRAHKWEALKYLLLRISAPLLLSALACTTHVRYECTEFGICYSAGQFWLVTHDGTPADLQSYNVWDGAGQGWNCGWYYPSLGNMTLLPKYDSYRTNPTPALLKVMFSGIKNNLIGTVITTVYELPLWCLWLPFVPFFVVAFRKWRTPPEGHCKKCEYNLFGIQSGICPECGHAFVPECKKQNSAVS